MNRKSSKKSFFSKPLVLVALAILVIATTIGATVAFLTSTGSVTNTFSPAKVAVSIQEKMTNGDSVKEDVAIKNDSDIPAWLRVAVVYSWQDEQGNTVAVPVTSADYTITGYNDTDWEIKGDFYYSKSEVDPDAVLELFDSITLNATENASKYHLHVEILAEAIQGAGTSAKDVWNQEEGT